MLEKSWGLVFLHWGLECLVPGGKWAFMGRDKGQVRSKNCEFWPSLLIPYVAVQKKKRKKKKAWRGWGDKKLVATMKRCKRWWRSFAVKGDSKGTAGLCALQKSPLAAHSAILYWERLMFQPCSSLGASGAVNSSTGHCATLTCLSVRSNDPGKDIGSFGVLSLSEWSNSLTISACSMEKGGAKSWWP